MDWAVFTCVILYFLLILRRGCFFGGDSFAMQKIKIIAI